MHIFYSERCTSFGMKDAHLWGKNSSFKKFFIRTQQIYSPIRENYSPFKFTYLKVLFFHSQFYFRETKFYFSQRNLRSLKTLRTLKSLNSLSSLTINKITKREKRFVEKHIHLRNKTRKNQEDIKIFFYLWTMKTNNYRIINFAQLQKV